MTELIYQLYDVEHWYGGLNVLQIDHLTVARGTVLGLVGPNGSGKSTLLRLLSFVESPTKGKIIFNGRSVNSSSSRERLHVTLLDQEPYLLKRSVFDNIVYGLKVRKDFSGSKGRASEALSWVGLAPDEFLHRKWFQLSGGELQRIALAARLVLKPEVLLLDEPTANVDANSANLIKQAALKARREWGTTLILASHDLAWLYQVCDELLSLFRGKLVGSMPGNAVFGPWRRRSDGQWEKRFQDEQSIVVPSVPDPDAVALIDPQMVEISRCPAEHGEACSSLRGTLATLSYQRQSGHILATVIVDSFPFNVKLPRLDSQQSGFQPGEEVWVLVRADDIRWL